MTSIPWRNRVLGAVVPGVALVSLASAMLDLPRANVIDALDSDRYRIRWLTASYLVGSAAGMSLTALIAGFVGLRRTYLLGLALFSLAAGLCGWAPSVLAMAPLRLLEGLGGGLVLCAGMVLLWRANPDRRDLAMAGYGLGVYLALLGGGVLGGLVTTYLSWRWLFWLDLPLGVVAIWLAWRTLPLDQAQTGPLRFDLIGFILFIGWVAALNVVLDMGQYWGWLTSPFFAPWLLAFLMFFAGFVAWGLLRQKPLVSLWPLSQRNFGLGLALKALFTINLTVIMSLLAGYMINLRGYQWWQGSLVLLPGLVVFVAVVLASGSWLETLRRPWRIGLGLGLMSLATWLFAGMDLYSDKRWLALVFAAWGAGVGLVVTPLLAVIFEGLTPEETIQGAGLFNMGRAIPAFAAGMCLITLLTRDTDYHFDRLRQAITRNRPLAAETTQRLAGNFAWHGSSGMISDQQAHAFLAKWVHANARAFAFQNVLRCLALYTFMGAVLSVALRPPLISA